MASPPKSAPYTHLPSTTELEYILYNSHDDTVPRDWDRDLPPIGWECFEDEEEVEEDSYFSPFLMVLVLIVAAWFGMATQ